MGLKAKFQVVSFRTRFRGWGAGSARGDVPLSTLFTHTCHRSAPIALDGEIIEKKGTNRQVKIFFFIGEVEWAFFFFKKVTDLPLKLGEILYLIRLDKF